MKIKITVTGTSPLLMHNPRMVDPEFEICRQIKAFTDKRKKTDEDRRQVERLEWYGGLYEEGGVIVQPTSKLRKCIVNTARMRKLGRAVERSISFGSLNVPLVYDGPADIDEVFAQKRFWSRLSVGVRGNRVMRVRPQFMPWAMSVDGVFVEDAGLNFDELSDLVELAGITEGIGDNRVNGYGRFVGEVKSV